MQLGGAGLEGLGAAADKDQHLEEETEEGEPGRDAPVNVARDHRFRLRESPLSRAPTRRKSLSDLTKCHCTI